jgi:hypothetical protein
MTLFAVVTALSSQVPARTHARRTAPTAVCRPAQPLAYLADRFGRAAVIIPGEPRLREVRRADRAARQAGSSWPCAPRSHPTRPRSRRCWASPPSGASVPYRARSPNHARSAPRRACGSCAISTSLHALVADLTTVEDRAQGMALTRTAGDFGRAPSRAGCAPPGDSAVRAAGLLSGAALGGYLADVSVCARSAVCWFRCRLEQRPSGSRGCVRCQWAAALRGHGTVRCQGARPEALGA